MSKLYTPPLDLERIRGLMARRDRADLLSEEALRILFVDLADEVPGLVAEVERLRLSAREWQAVAERWCDCVVCGAPATHIDESNEINLHRLYCASHAAECESAEEMASPADVLGHRLHEERARALEDAADATGPAGGGASPVWGVTVADWLRIRARTGDNP